MGSFVNLPRVRRRAERYDIVGRRTCEGASPIIIRVAVRVRTRVLKHQRVLRRLAYVGCAVRAATAVLLLLERLARALARDSFPAGARHSQLRRTTVVQISDASGVRTVGAGAALGNHQHRQVVTVDEADVIEVLPCVAIERELRKRGGGSSAATGAF